ncbi:hypothetical protein DXG01_010079, partial [Tephrocybe rancida]
MTPDSANPNLGSILLEQLDINMRTEKNDQDGDNVYHPPQEADCDGNTVNHPPSTSSPFFLEKHPMPSKTYGKGKTMLDEFYADNYAEERTEMLYYPFVTRSEWQLGAFLILNIGLSFGTSKDLYSRVEILPKGPQWKGMPWPSDHPTKTPLSLFYRDPLECIQSLLISPLVKDHLSMDPFRLFKTAEKLTRVYTEWLSGDLAWQMKSNIPAGATLLGTILSSDKTTISAMTGNRGAHPLLINIANLDMDFRTKSSNHAYMLLALLPIPSFVYKDDNEKELVGVWEARLIHECLDFVVAPLKKAAEVGVMMNDPLGYRRYCFTPLAGYVVDTPESQLLATVKGNTSSVTMASYHNFGDSFRHPSRTGTTTLRQLQAVEALVDPMDIANYVRSAKEHYRLLGVHKPFWRDWPLSDPSNFLTPEPLHHWHKAFWDHDVKWCIKAVGWKEIDFRFHIIHPHTGYRHFKEGISKIKQVTGREHRDLQWYIVGVISGRTPQPFVVAIRALNDFRYLAQSPVIDDNMCDMLLKALKEFHDHKDAIMASSARLGKRKKNKVWGIPKLEFLQSVVPSIRANGVA